MKREVNRLELAIVAGGLIALATLVGIWLVGGVQL